MATEIEERRSYTKRRLEELRGILKDTTKLVSGKACIYATGSYARGEATSHSDLDLFIVGLASEDAGKFMPALSKLDEICVKADLIELTREAKIAEFSGDGQYLVHYTVRDLVAAIGTPEDDANNTLTARLLLLLESTPLLEDEVYRRAIDDVIASYWRDFDRHKSDFIPVFLANDILRLWRTFCVNYEARTRSGTPRERAKRQLKNYKLRHSRLLTCFSGIVFLLTSYVRRKAVTPEDAQHMAQLAPIERLEYLRDEDGNLSACVQAILSQYEEFLGRTNAAEEKLLDHFLDDGTRRRYFADANRLGDAVFHLLFMVGDGNPLLRHLLV